MLLAILIVLLIIIFLPLLLSLGIGDLALGLVFIVAFSIRLCYIVLVRLPLLLVTQVGFGKNNGLGKARK